MNSFQLAIDIAKQQKAALFELKAGIDMANAARSKGQSKKAIQSLRDTCANLPEDFDAPQLAQARQLLSAQTN